VTDVSTAPIARIRLHRCLARLGQFALQDTAALLGAWDAARFEEFALLAYGVFERVESETVPLLELPSVDEDEALSESSLGLLSRCLAVAGHGFAAVKYHRGRLEPRSDEPLSLLAALDLEERRYQLLLIATRQGARIGSVRLIHQALLDCIDAMRAEVGYIAQGLGGQPDAARRSGLAAVRAGLLARRYAMLAAACLHLMFRLANARKAAGIRQVANRRERLFRSKAAWVAAPSIVHVAEPDTDVPLTARCDAVSWVDDGDGYTSIEVAAGEVGELRVPRRNAMRAGLARGCWLFAEGTLRESGAGAFLEVSLLPTTSHAAEVWEDYLVTQARPVYDLYPRSIDMFWELPDLREPGARNELHGRL